MHLDMDFHFMMQALKLAERASAADEIPVGAVVVLGERVVGVGYNRTISLLDPTAHAEVLALRDAARRLGNYRLQGASVYVTVEPCIMCLGALRHARVKHLVYGCTEPRWGAVESSSSVAWMEGLSWRKGVCATAAEELLKKFFLVRRGA